MPNLKFLALQNNLLDNLGSSLTYLHDLEFLDLGQNRIETLSIEDSLPPSIMFLKLRGNPIAAQPLKYRQPFVEQLADLQELDKIRVMPAERLSYQGMLPKLNLETLLKDLIDKRAKEEANQRLE